MAYKGLIFDVDGTAVPLGAQEASPELQAVIQNNKDKLHLAAATGRSLEFAKPILTSLGLTDPCVIMGGSVIVDPTSFGVLWQKNMDAQQVSAVSNILRSFDATVHICEQADQHSTQLDSSVPSIPLLVIYALAMHPEKALALIEELSVVDNVAAHTTPSWEIGNVDVHITHLEGTKEHGIHQLKDILGLTSEELVGVGDSANDMPIFAAVGLKVAMGNGTNELKDLADQIAPTVDENGLAYIINQVANAS